MHTVQRGALKTLALMWLERIPLNSEALCFYCIVNWCWQRVIPVLGVRCAVVNKTDIILIREHFIMEKAQNNKAEYIEIAYTGDNDGSSSEGIMRTAGTVT